MSRMRHADSQPLVVHAHPRRSGRRTARNVPLRQMDKTARAKWRRWQDFIAP